MDVTQILLGSDYSSLKLLKEGSSTLNVTAAPAYGESVSIATIPHGYGSDNLLFQVAAISGHASGSILPWQSNDGRLMLYGRLNSTNLEVVAIASDAGGSGFAAFTLEYSYRILIP